MSFHTAWAISCRRIDGPWYDPEIARAGLFQPVRLPHLLHQRLVDEGINRLHESVAYQLVLRGATLRPLLRQPTLLDEVPERFGVGAVAHAQHVVIALLVGAVLVGKVVPLFGLAADALLPQ